MASGMQINQRRPPRCRRKVLGHVPRIMAATSGTLSFKVANSHWYTSTCRRTSTKREDYDHRDICRVCRSAEQHGSPADSIFRAVYQLRALMNLNFWASQSGWTRPVFYPWPHRRSFTFRL